MATTTNFGWTTPDDTALVKDGASAIRTLGSSIDTSMSQLKGGTTGQILSKTSNTDMAFTWINNDQGDITEVTTAATSGLTGGATSGAVALRLNTSAKGSIIAGTGAATLGELTVGANNTVLTADSTTATGLKWAAASGPTFVGCIAYGAVNLSFGTTATVLSSLTTEIIDTHGFHSTTTNTERMTIPSGYGGTYLINLDTNLASTASMQNIYLRLRKNGTNVTEGLTNGNLATNLTGSPQDGHFNVSMIVTAVAGDYFDFTLQTGGSSSTTDKVRYSISYLGA